MIDFNSHSTSPKKLSTQTSSHYETHETPDGKFFNPASWKISNRYVPPPSGPFFWHQAKHAFSFLFNSDYRTTLPVRSIRQTDFHSGIRVYWIGHATVLIQINEIFILTDPIFKDRASPVPGLVHRVTKAPIGCHDLPPISYVLISHNHYDHLDDESCSQLNNLFHPLFLVPKKVSLPENCNLEEFDWLQIKKMGQITFQCLPACHTSGRSGFDYGNTLWCSWLIQTNEFSVYFAGDTAIGPHFREIQQIQSQIDLALMPVGPQEPVDMMRGVHLNPPDCFQMCLDLGAKKLLPIHWGTFPLGIKPKVEDIEWLTRCFQNEICERKNILKVLNPGEYLEWNSKSREFERPNDFD